MFTLGKILKIILIGLGLMMAALFLLALLVIAVGVLHRFMLRLRTDKIVTDKINLTVINKEHRGGGYWFAGGKRYHEPEEFIIRAGYYDGRRSWLFTLSDEKLFHTVDNGGTFTAFADFYLDRHDKIIDVKLT